MKNKIYHQTSESHQLHVHEVVGSVMVASNVIEPHAHRFATVSGEAIFDGDGFDHFHDVTFRTDYYKNHYHEFRGGANYPLMLDEKKHVHLVSGFTTFNNGHRHEFMVATLIENQHQKIDLG